MAFDAGTVVARLTLNTRAFTSGISDAQRAMQEMEGEATGLRGRMGRLGLGMTKVGKGMTLGVTAPLVGLGTAAVKTAADFDSSMAKVKAVTGATDNDFDKLRQSAKKLGSTTAFSASEAAEGMEYLGMAGYDTNQIIEAMPGLLDLAAASGSDLGTTSDIVSDSMTAFGLSADNTSHFADMVAKASSSANTNVELLGESFKYAAPVAKSFGLTAEETTTALSLMANSGIKGSQAGTTLRGALTRMIKPSKDAAFLMDELGIKIADAEGNMLPFQEVMGSVRNGFSSLTEEQRNHAASVIFGQEALSGMLAVINTSDEDFKAFNESLTFSDGQAKKMAETMQNNLNGSITQLKSALEGLVISIGERLVPIIIAATQKINAWVTWFNNLSESQKDVIVKIGLVVAAIGPMLLVFGKIIGVVTQVSGLFGTLTGLLGGASAAAGGVTASSGILSGALTALTGPVGVVIAAVTSLIAIFVSLYKTNEEFREKVNALWEDIKESLRSIWEGIKEIGMATFNLLRAFWESWGSSITSLFMVIFDQVASIIRAALGVIQGIINVAMGLITGDWERTWTGVKTILESVWKLIKGIIEKALKLIYTVIMKTLGKINDIWRRLWNKVFRTIKGVWDKINDFVKDALKNLVRGIKDSSGGFEKVGRRLFESVWKGMKGIWSSISRWVFKKIRWLSDKLAFWRRSQGEMASGSKRHAMGVYNSSGGYTALVGENGPELLTVPRGASITPHGRLKQTLGGNKGGQGDFNLSIAQFNNYSEKDIEQLAYELEYYRQRVKISKGGIG